MVYNGFMIFLVKYFLPILLTYKPQQRTFEFFLHPIILVPISAFIIFLILAVALRASDGRLVVESPALFLGSSLAALRTLHLRLNERWEYALALGIGVVVVQLGAALHYLPLTPIRFGLALLAPAYALTILAISLVMSCSGIIWPGRR